MSDHGAGGPGGGNGPPPRWPPPPGTGPRGAARPPWGAPAPGRAGASPRRLLWGLVAVGILAALVSSHRVSEATLIVIAVLLPSVILHEVAHGAMAYAFGDGTAKRAGRLTLNPFAHVDPVGTVIVPAITVLSGWGFFGWAKPVPVTVSRLRSPRNHGVLVALAGPAVNAVIAAVAGFAFVSFYRGGDPLWAQVLFWLGMVNVWVAAFNLLPVPPLDGSVLVERLLPASWWPEYLRLRRHALPVLLGTLLLLSFAHVYPTEPLLAHLESWWAHLLGL